MTLSPIRATFVFPQRIGGFKINNYLISKIEKIKNILSTLPDGKLICAKNGGINSWYQSFGSTRKYIPKHNKQLAQQLALKAYYKEYLACLESEKFHTDKLTNIHIKIERIQNLYFRDKPGFRDLLTPAFQTPNHDYYAWANADFPTNPLKPDDRRIQTLDGHYVRSKSEAMIADALFENHVPYRYEEELSLDGHLLYPDFTGIQISTGKKLYWEHFGMMHMKSYRNRTFEKLEQYANAGYHPTIGLITTYESYESPLSPAKIQRTIEEYLL